MPEIQIPVFQGPLLLLLQLIEKDDLDITAVSLVAVTDQYLKAIHEGDGVAPAALAEFIAIGAKLIYLKSRALLPRAPTESADALEEDEVGRELVDLLIEYRRFAEVADQLQQRQEDGMHGYPRLVPAPARPEGSGLDGVTAELMRKIMLDVLARIPAIPRVLIPRDRATLSERISNLRERLRSAGRFSFRRVMSECRTRLEVVLSFLAILELLKSGECDAQQDENWGDIEVVALAPVATPAS
ncbi:MAG: segregation and condensation protein A [Dehalococcoidia bacterium]